MAKYEFSPSTLELDEFKEFLKRNTGSDDVSSLYDYERDAWIWLFKYSKNDIDDNDKRHLSDVEKEVSQDIKDALAGRYFQGRNYDELEDNEKAFVSTLGRKLEQYINTGRIAESEKAPAENQTLQDINKEDEKQDSSSDKARVRSSSSDKNESVLDALQLNVLKDMGKIDVETLQGISSPADAIAVLHDFRSNNELTRAEWKEFENRLTERMVDSEMLAHIPPKLLGQKYEELRQAIADAPQDADTSKEQEMLTKIEQRIDNLCSDLEKKEGFYFADVTNISDAYDGYMIMLEARAQGLGDTSEDNQKKAVIESGKNYLNELIASYDNDWNLDGENLRQNAEQRFERLNELLPSVQISDETLQLISNFKFTNEQGQAEPQFELADGTLSDTWSQGAKVIPESKLDNVIMVAKQNVLMRELGSDTQMTPEYLQSELNEEVPATLFSLHVSDRVVKNGLEHPDEFTNEKYLKDFVRNLADVEHPMSISPRGYRAGIDSCINSTGAYAHRLNKKLGQDSSIPARLFEPLKKLDKRAADRVVDGKINLRERRINELKSLGKYGLSAFLVSGAITTLGTIAASDATLTAATGGLNKLAGAALGVTLGVTMTARAIWKWRKQRKKEGLPCGLKAMVQNPQLMTSVTTTVLGATALGFAATGNPGVAMALGSGSLIVGGGGGAILSYNSNVKGGMSKAEAAAWAIGRASITGLAALMGRYAANVAIDAYNQYNPDNTLFQHKEHTGSHPETTTTTETVIDYGVLDQNAKEFLQNNWYKDNPDLLNSRIEALQAGGVENPYHTLLTAHDAGMRAPDNMPMYDGGTSNGYHTVFGEGFAQQHNIPYDSIQDMKMLFNSDGSVNPEAIQAYESLKSHVGLNNFVSTIDNRPVNDVLYPERHSTYDHDKTHFPTKEVETTSTSQKEDFDMVRNKTDLGVGMVGVLEHPLKAAKRLKERVGAFMDRILNRKKESGKIVKDPDNPKEGNIKDPGKGRGNIGWFHPGKPPRESANPRKGINPGIGVNPVEPPKQGKEPGNPKEGNIKDPGKGRGNIGWFHPGKPPKDPANPRKGINPGIGVNPVEPPKPGKEPGNPGRGRPAEPPKGSGNQRQHPDPDDPSTWRLDLLQGDNVFYDKHQGEPYNEVMGLDTNEVKDKNNSDKGKGNKNNPKINFEGKKPNEFDANKANKNNPKIDFEGKKPNEFDVNKGNKNNPKIDFEGKQEHTVDGNKNILDIVESVRKKLKDKETADDTRQQAPDPNDPSTWRLDKLQGDNVFYDEHQGEPYNEVMGLNANEPKEKTSANNQKTSKQSNSKGKIMPSSDKSVDR